MLPAIPTTSFHFPAKHRANTTILLIIRMLSCIIESLAPWAWLSDYYCSCLRECEVKTNHRMKSFKLAVSYLGNNSTRCYETQRSWLVCRWITSERVTKQLMIWWSNLTVNNTNTPLRLPDRRIIILIWVYNAVVRLSRFVGSSFPILQWKCRIW